MIVGIGTDIVQCQRIEALLERLGDSFAKRILTPVELQQFHLSKTPTAFLAKRFAEKEATAKALGTGIGRGVSFQHITVGHNGDGAPQLQLTEGAAARFAILGANHCHISISDEADYATAFVVLES